jgi:hypothetical protein
MTSAHLRHWQRRQPGQVRNESRTVKPEQVGVWISLKQVRPGDFSESLHCERCWQVHIQALGCIAWTPNSKQLTVKTSLPLPPPLMRLHTATRSILAIVASSRLSCEAVTCSQQQEIAGSQYIDSYSRNREHHLAGGHSQLQHLQQAHVAPGKYEKKWPYPTSELSCGIQQRPTSNC